MSENRRLAIVTGGIGGIGTAICERLAKDGIQVVATYHPAEEEKLAEWNKARAEAGVEVAVAVCDVSSAEDSARMVAEVQNEFGPVDIIVNCAGITRDMTMKRMDAENWEAVINTNLNSAFYVTKPAWVGMLERGFGRVINISSVNGQRGQFGQANYSAAKAGMHGFTMALAYEGAAKGVTANTVSPGYIATAMTAAMREDVLESIVSGIPMRRLGKPEEIASAVAFLAADEQAYITGANIPVNGALFVH
ncbi:acetoacetyl-CoA reductase [Sedimenticola thiotaurini]|uniref:3-ketoacyl-ACP reductase n=1 Tax=Sedimenticola thiotaurini TaxID=1543721 RepID=A0A0F7JZ66_9GAMM|nr:acetoacetyl-CoA reductase [Sedimenticola thiotaurini]AKH20170.1 3-ketoacyl-ACP reductase [Sedimenticola thiotaurini]